MYHQSGFDRHAFTYKRRPVTLEFFQKFQDQLQAIAFRRKLKGWSKAKKEALIKSDFEMIQTLAECRNATHFKYKP